MSRLRTLAFYLPQYFPIPENDEWWGRGFTEWTNVAKARRCSRATSSRTMPAELGFYDLRVPETRAAQAELAQEHGSRRSATGTTGSTAAAARAAVRGGAGLGAAGHPVLPRVGEPGVDRHVARRGTGAQGPALLARRRRGAHGLAARRLRRPALSAGRREPAVPRVTGHCDLAGPAPTADTIRAGRPRRAPRAAPARHRRPRWGHDFRADRVRRNGRSQPALVCYRTKLCTGRRLGAVAQGGTISARNVRLGAWSSTAKVHSYRRTSNACNANRTACPPSVPDPPRRVGQLASP